MALYRTTDEGTTWTEIGHWWGDLDPRRWIHPDQRVIAFSKTVSGVVYGGNDGGVVRSTNSGLDWTNLNQNLPGALMYSVALSADGSMMAGTQDNGAVFSSAGAHWEHGSPAGIPVTLSSIRVTARGHITSYMIGIRLRGSTRRPTNRQTSLQLNWREMLTALSFHHSA